ncbi:hypothetical protein BV25DRAFT_710661 [Artomyces pyxidatus]|uniref:Uncharacterized protein n=1 Tax=Artomyces pyxidatus TaxID=48021 RepID=A0ACB8T158_9AGAM|nr:hypothetical protein BV25DRAFT_710661 [Artomyces pyxidatus]
MLLSSRIASFAIYPTAATKLTAVSRGFLAAQYRVTNCHLMGTVKADRNIPPGAAREMVFPGHPQNPGLPRVPGEPGTLISNRPEFRQHRVLSLWVKTTGTDTKAWMYFGEYEVKESPQALSGQEFSHLPEPTKQTWVTSLFTSTHQCYASMSAKIWLHKHGIASTPALIREKTEQFLAQIRTQKKMKPSPKVGPGDMSKDDILEGLCDGVAMFDVLTLRCVGYDHEFETGLAAGWKRWLTTKGM